MRATVSKWGNSLALRVPRGLAEDAHLAEGAEVELFVQDGRLVVEPVLVIRLETLLAGITPENLHDEHFTDAPRGREAW